MTSCTECPRCGGTVVLYEDAEGGLAGACTSCQYWLSMSPAESRRQAEWDEAHDRARVDATFGLRVRDAEETMPLTRGGVASRRTVLIRSASAERVYSGGRPAYAVRIVATAGGDDSRTLLTYGRIVTPDDLGWMQEAWGRIGDLPGTAARALVLGTRIVCIELSTGEVFA